MVLGLETWDVGNYGVLQYKEHVRHRLSANFYMAMNNILLDMNFYIGVLLQPVYPNSS